LGTEKDSIAALRWYRAAAAQGNSKAKDFLNSFKPSATTRYIELSLGLLELVAGAIFLVPSLYFVLPGRKLLDWRHAGTALLGLVFVMNAVLSWYASAHYLRYSPYGAQFHFIRRVSIGVAAALIATVVFPAKKKKEESTAHQAAR
jgi:TPR repeat protein